MMRVAGCKGVSFMFDMVASCGFDILTCAFASASTVAFEDRVFAPNGGAGDGRSQLGGTVLITGEGSGFAVVTQEILRAWWLKANLPAVKSVLW